jgi:predicted PurR-regulated permease PerM
MFLPFFSSKSILFFFFKALEQITIKMKNVYKDHQIHRCKQRFTRLRQTLTRMRQMQLEPESVH